MRRLGLAMVVACLLVLSASPRALALPDFNPPTAADTGRPGGCPPFERPEVGLPGDPFVVGYPIIGFTVGISAAALKFVGTRSAACGADFVAPLPFVTWRLVSQPSGSTAQLRDETTLTPQLPLDAVGTYEVLLTVCPGGCEIHPTDAHADPIFVAEEFRLVTIEALASAALGPETMPEVVPSAETPRSEPLPDQCSSGAGLLAPQWWAVRQIESPDDYRLLEGFVKHSRVSRKDSPSNHASQDTNYHIDPDPKYTNLLMPRTGSQEDFEIEVEWERNSIPERFRPTAGDRASIFGYWVRDCAHGRPEIHPPVGIAVQRPRPIRIPDTETFTEFGDQPVGTGVHVPGIITDLYFSDAGGTLAGCTTDGLANALRVPVAGGISAPACVPAPSIRRVFEFDIYLPRNPQVVMQQAGLLVQPVPLYQEDEELEPIHVFHPAPTIERRTTASGITYLHVRLDLRNYFAPVYAHRIAAGWVLPSPDNWGLARWKLRLDRLDVYEDGEADESRPFGFLSRPGQWRLWLNTNNATNESVEPQEWTKILDRDVFGRDQLHDGVVDFADGGPFETDAANPARSLGPDLLRYPTPSTGVHLIPGPIDYGIRFHLTGYESDRLASDDAGTVLETHARPGMPPLENQCEPSVQFHVLYSGCVWYNATYSVEPGPLLPRPVLSQPAKSLADQYLLRCPSPPGSNQVGVCEGLVADPIAPRPVSPADEVLDPDEGAIDFTEFPAFEAGEREEGALTDITIAEFAALMSQARQTDPVSVARALDKLRVVFDEGAADPAIAEETIEEAQIVRAGLPPDLWSSYFAGFPAPQPDPVASKTKMIGSGRMLTPGAKLRFDAALNCAAAGTPNAFVVEWGASRFDLDLALRAECAVEPGSDGRIHTLRGRGVGRYDGVAGAIAEWTLVDGGSAGDTATITLRTDDAAEPVLEVSGPLLHGNLASYTRP